MNASNNLKSNSFALGFSTAARTKRAALATASVTSKAAKSTARGTKVAAVATADVSTGFFAGLVAGFRG